MYAINTFLYVLLLLSFVSFDGVSARKYDRPAIKDSTILRSTVSCPNCPVRNCYKCRLGHEKTLQANTGGLAFVRTLIGFRMPVDGSLVAKCTLQIPAFTTPLQYPVNVTFSRALSSSWNEGTVTGENAPDSGPPFNSVTVPAHTNMGPIDITQACRWANRRRFSIYIGTQFGRIEFWSKDSGNPAILHITTYT
ncbi:hypothetical protein GGI12_001961 [Dipsacomyces acuminosporus]|nr:hypothetical protein GGI12_001961 [Dipsacomyces acuminosporus]